MEYQKLLVVLFYNFARNQKLVDPISDDEIDSILIRIEQVSQPGLDRIRILFLFKKVDLTLVTLVKLVKYFSIIFLKWSSVVPNFLILLTELHYILLDYLSVSQ